MRKHKSTLSTGLKGLSKDPLFSLGLLNSAFKGGTRVPMGAEKGLGSYVG